ncbi:hypothetical protein D8L93_03575 [Sodalis-like symbiont of Bactericera trigonica]|nr:hypothetical protein D8L93_03575 [Sodalis-like symbiont of Bactericera trigonica]
MVARACAGPKAGVLEGITLIRETFRVMGNPVSRKATSALRGLLADIVPLIGAEQADPQVICYQPVYLRTKLALMSWLVVQRLSEHRR